MRKLIGLLILLALAVSAALLLESSWGNVTLWIPPYRVDLSLQSALVILVVVVLATLLLTRLVMGLLGIPERVRQFRKRRLQEQRLQHFAFAVRAYFEGRFARALKEAQPLQSDAGLQESSPEVVAATHAIAAKAAHALRDIPLRDQWVSKLQSASTRQDEQQRSLGFLLEAEFAVDDHRGAQALKALSRLSKGEGRQIHSTRLALKANQQEAQWDEVLRIARLLENRKALPKIAAVRYKHMVAEAWIREGRHQEAALLIQEGLKQYWDSGLVFLYGQCDSNAKEQLAVAEGWLQKHPQDAEVNWVLGRLCQRLQIWGKARMHLEASLRHKPMLQTHLALAEIAEALSDQETASQHWKAAARFR